MIENSKSVKHTDWAHENEVRLLVTEGRTPLLILGQVFTSMHFLSIKALNRLAPQMVKDYLDVGVMQRVVDLGDLQAPGQSIGYKPIPADSNGCPTPAVVGLKLPSIWLLNVIG